MCDTAIGQQHVGFPLSWISGRIPVDISWGLAHGHGQSLIAAWASDSARRRMEEQ
jgi:hypothetical protein